MTEHTKKASSFLIKTFQMLSSNLYATIIEWRPDGNGFTILKPTPFSTQVLPTYFKHCNLSSFIRQLNMYGFSKPRDSMGRSYYQHPHFRKDDIDSIRLIHRKTQNKPNKTSLPHQQEYSPLKSQITMLFCLNQSLLNEQMQNLHLLMDQLQQPQPTLLQKVERYAAVHRGLLSSLQLDAKKLLSIDIGEVITHSTIRE